MLNEIMGVDQEKKQLIHIIRGMKLLVEPSMTLSTQNVVFISETTQDLV